MMIAKPIRTTAEANTGPRTIDAKAGTRGSIFENYTRRPNHCTRRRFVPIFIVGSTGQCHSLSEKNTSKTRLCSSATKGHDFRSENKCEAPRLRISTEGGEFRSLEIMTGCLSSQDWFFKTRKWIFVGIGTKGADLYAILTPSSA